MLKAHKIFATISLLVFTVMVQGYIVTNYATFSTLDTINKVFTLVFPMIFIGFLWGVLEQSRLHWKIIIKLVIGTLLANIILGFIFVKTTDFPEQYLTRKYQDMNDVFVKTNPDVIQLEQYKAFKHSMDMLDPSGLQKAKDNYYHIKSVEGYMADLIRVTTNASNIPELKAKLAEIDADHYISIMEYDEFVKVVRTLPETKETQVYKNIYSKILQSR